MTVAFLFGLTLDYFMHTPGLHAAACVLIAYLRPFVVNMLISQEGADKNYLSPSITSMGWAPYFTYVFVLDPFSSRIPCFPGMLAEKLGHLDEMAEQRLPSLLAEQMQIADRREGPGAGSRRFEREEARRVLARMIQVRHHLRRSGQQSKVAPVLGEEQARDVGTEAGLVEVDADRIGESEMADLPIDPGEGPDRPRPKAERVLLPRVVAEDRPRPADHRVGVDVRPIRQPELDDQPIAQEDDRFEIVESERVGRAHRGDERGDPLSLGEVVAPPTSSRFTSMRVVRSARDDDDVAGPEAEPAGDVESAIVTDVGSEQHRVSRTPWSIVPGHAFSRPSLTP